MEFASQDVFKRCVDRYKGNYQSRGFTCWKQFLFLAFGQLTHRESMSDEIMMMFSPCYYLLLITPAIGCAVGIMVISLIFTCCGRLIINHTASATSAAIKFSNPS